MIRGAATVTSWRGLIVHAALLVIVLNAVSPAGSGAAAQARDVTFSNDIAPLIFAHCTSCHRPDGAAPFSLLTYADVKSRAEQIAAVTKSRYMPPWKPEPGYGDFVGSRRLSDEQVGLVQRWVAGGMAEGDPAAAPAPPAFSSAWRLGEPDLVLTMARPYTVAAAGDDIYRHFVIPIPVPDRRFVKAWELRPGNSRVVHHATMEIDQTGASRHLDEHDPEPGYEGLIAHTAMAPDGYFLDWAPGHTPYVAPDGMAFPVEKGGDLILMLHLRPTGREETVQVRVGLYFTDTPPTRVPALLRLTRQDLEIPAGNNLHVVTSSYRLPVDLDLFTVQPHAHNLAREIEGFARLADGSTRPLLYIRDWDFNWQGVYRYAEPVFLPAGTTVVARWTYDNSSDNPRNPNRPPKAVTFGQRTSDEMAELWFQVVPRNQADRDVLTRALKLNLLPENIKGYEMMLRAEPDRVTLHDDVALLYAQAGNADGMARHFAETARLQPDSARAQYNLGSARLVQARRDEARQAFQRAVELDPTYANAHRSLGMVLYRDGRLDDASRAYQRALQLAPEDVAAHHNFAVLLQAQGKLTEAIAHYREAVRLNGNYADAHYGLALAFKAQGSNAEAVTHYRQALRSLPDWPIVMTQLAWVLATSPDPAVREAEEALKLAERGAQLTRPATPMTLDVLAAAQAAAGRFDQAAATARQAVDLATAAGDDLAARQIRERLDLYNQRKPYFESP
jgi:tetratricopeptide (TPR) repeat protein/mono/diheme cytochrome c family protein